MKNISIVGHSRLVALLCVASLLTPMYASADTTGALVAGANAAVTSNAGDNNGFETTPGNADGNNNNSYAVSASTGTGNATDGCTTFNQSEDDAHNYYNFGIAIPAGSTVDGIQVNDSAKWSTNTGTNNLCYELSWDGGTSWTSTHKGTGDIQTTESAHTMGGAADTWGRTWTTDEVSDANFRLRVMIDPGQSNTTSASLDVLTVAVSYTPPSAPTVVTNSPAGIGTFFATFSGTISSTGGQDATDTGFAYGTDLSLATVIATTSLGSFTGTGDFTTDNRNLDQSTTYYVRAYATNGAGTGYGSVVPFTTSDVIPARSLRLISGKIKINEGGRLIIHQR